MAKLLITELFGVRCWHISASQGETDMANKKIDLQQKVAALRECLTMHNVKATMAKYGFSEQSARNWFSRVSAHLPEILASRKPGPKGQRPKRSPFLRGE
jgi:hypothetical protein